VLEALMDRRIRTGMVKTKTVKKSTDAGTSNGMSPNQAVVTRIAPSPTGRLHVGTARAALFNFLFARKYSGTFILRVEDTDKVRSKKEFEEDIISGLGWLGLTHDAFFRQSERTQIYTTCIQKLIESGRAYISKEPQKDNLDVEVEVVRLKNPNKEITFADLIRGDITFDTTELGDFVIARTQTEPLYHLTVVVDDHDMKITQVIRGDDHINNTPRQINLLQALGWPLPEYAHVPMILGDDGTRLSKRHGAVGVMQYKKEGYLPEALLNYLVRLGWSYGDQEIFSIDEMLEYFELDAVNKAPSTFNTDKLRWLNQHYIKHADLDRLTRLVEPFLTEIGVDYQQGADLREVVDAQRERAMTLVELAAICAFYYRDFDDFDEKSSGKAFKGEAVNMLEAVSDGLSKIETWEREAIHRIVKQTVESMGVGFGKVAMPLRIAVTGGAPSPDLDLTLQLVGQEATIRRIKAAIRYINQRDGAMS